MTVFWELRVEEDVPGYGTVAVLSNKAKQDVVREFEIRSHQQPSLDKFASIGEQVKHVVASHDYTESQIVDIIIDACRRVDQVKCRDLVFISDEKSSIVDLVELIKKSKDYEADGLVFIGGGNQYLKSGDDELAFVESYN